MLIEFNTLQKHSYIFDVCSCCISKVISQSVRFNIIRSSTLFTFRYTNLMVSFLQYISFYFNIDIATFVGFQIAVFVYVELRKFLHTVVRLRIYTAPSLTQFTKSHLCRKVYHKRHGYAGTVINNNIFRTCGIFIELGKLRHC